MTQAFFIFEMVFVKRLQNYALAAMIYAYLETDFWVDAVNIMYGEANAL